MRSIIKQIYNGHLCLSERKTVRVSEFRTARDIAVQAHDVFEDKLCQSMKQAFLDGILSCMKVIKYPLSDLMDSRFVLLGGAAVDDR